MDFASSARFRALAAVLVAAGVALLGLALRHPGWRPGDAFLAQSYDTLHSLGTPRDGIPGTSPVAVVYLDLHSFLTAKVDPARPWPRDWHANLVRRLTEAGARAIVFDVVFGGPGPDAAADTALADAIRDSGRVVLAGESSGDASQRADPDGTWARLVQVEAPDPRFATNAVAWGVANHLVDDDFVVRRYFAGFTSRVQPSLSWAVAEWLDLPVTREGADPRRPDDRRWLRYYGPALTLPHVSYVQALRADGVPDGFFRDRIVFIGARPMAELFQGRQDEFRSPFHSWDHKALFHPGVEVHATSLLNLLRGDGLRRPSAGREPLLLIIVAGVFGGGLLWLRPWPATLAAAVGAGATLAIALGAFGRGTWFPWLIPAAAQIPVALFGSWLFHFREWQVTRRRLEAARQADEARIREQAALIDKATDAILVHDLDGRVRYANPAAERLSGWTAAELRNGAAPGLEIEPGAFRRAETAAVERGEWQGELRLRDRRGRDLVVESRWTLIRAEDGSPGSLLAILADVTEKRQLEAESLRLQRMEAIGALASGMAHDLNNALAPVLMGAQLLHRQVPDEESRRILQLMEAGTRRGADMVRQVLLFARGRQGEMLPLDLRPVVQEMEKLVRETFPRNLAIGVITAADLWPVLGHPTELHQVLLNLCVNARDAMPGGGSLDLALDNVTLDAPAAAAFPGGRPGDYVCLLVADTGTGIPPEVLPRIFDPFFTTKPEGSGTGLGLSSAARIVKAHGGFIGVGSDPGQGTTFEVFLPRLVGESGAGLPDDTIDAVPRGRGELILVADDDLAVAEMIRRGLEDHGYRVRLATNGAEAVAAFKLLRSQVTLAICDRSMPVLDGPGTRAALRQMAPGLPVLLMSGGADGTAGEAGASGVDGEWLPKPLPLPVLLRRVREALGA